MAPSSTCTHLCAVITLSLGSCVVLCIPNYVWHIAKLGQQPMPPTSFQETKCALLADSAEWLSSIGRTVAHQSFSILGFPSPVA